MTEVSGCGGMMSVGDGREWGLGVGGPKGVWGVSKEGVGREIGGQLRSVTDGMASMCLPSRSQSHTHARTITQQPSSTNVLDRKQVSVERQQRF